MYQLWSLSDLRTLVGASVALGLFVVAISSVVGYPISDNAELDRYPGDHDVYQRAQQHDVHAE